MAGAQQASSAPEMSRPQRSDPSRYLAGEVTWSPAMLLWFLRAIFVVHRAEERQYLYNRQLKGYWFCSTFVFQM